MTDVFSYILAHPGLGLKPRGRQAGGDGCCCTEEEA